MLVVDSVLQMKKYLSIKKDLPKLKVIVMFSEATFPKDLGTEGLKVYLWKDFL